MAAGFMWGTLMGFGVSTLIIALAIVYPDVFKIEGKLDVGGLWTLGDAADKESVRRITGEMPRRVFVYREREE